MTKESYLSNSIEPSLLFRPGTAEDLLAAHTLFIDTIWDLSWRLGIQDGERVPTDAERATSLRQWQPILAYLTETADQYWVAERGDEIVGYARSILRDGVRELTEFFVSPNAQSDGIGRELLSRAMPPGSARRTYIMGSLDLRAQALYHKLGVYQACAVYTFAREVQGLPPLLQEQNDLIIDPITEAHIPMLAKLDQAIHGHRRDIDHDWLMKQRSGFILFREQHPVGYGYVGDPFSGPFVMLDDANFPVALAHAERTAIDRQFHSIALDVPMLNRTAIKYLLSRGYQMSPFFCFYMCSEPPIHVDKTIITAPMIMV